MSEIASSLADLTESVPEPPTTGFVLTCLALNLVLALKALLLCVACSLLVPFAYVVFTEAC
jgi:hypothetical protein